MADWKIDLSQNSGVVPPMWNMESGGSKPTNLSKEQILANALNDYRANLPETFTKVLCNDGTTQNVGSNPLGGRVDMPCRNNGGVSNNQPIADAQKEVAYQSVNLSQEEKFYESLGLKDKGGLTLPLKSKGRLLVAVVLVAGYFAYKKFKK
jgi:hypothetical protein